MSYHITWKKFHKWAGLVLAVFLLVFSISGIILNHREFVSGVNVSRAILPQAYHLTQYNNGVVKGTLRLEDDSVLVYGNCGAWLTNQNFDHFTDYNNGFPSGIDRRNIKNIIRSNDGILWCATQFGVFRFVDDSWEKMTLPNDGERISDITFNSDSTSILALSRSKIFSINPNGNKITAHTLKGPEGVKRKYTLFKTFWMIHSGELFGMPGRIIVDIIAAIISFLCLTGILLFCLPYRIKWKKHNRDCSTRTMRFFKWNFKWHDKVGYITVILTIVIVITGMCLRVPLMIPLVLTNTAPIPYTTQDSENYWQDKLRGLRWEDSIGKWLISTSEGFIIADKDFSNCPYRISHVNQPPVSPMGITVFEKLGNSEWLIGSFSGLYKWDLEEGNVTDFFTGKDFNHNEQNYATEPVLVSGVSRDLNLESITIFDYAKGNQSLPEMSQELRKQPMSLWNVALELHVGRCYTPFLGPFSTLFVFFSGLLFTLILISGIIIRKKFKINNSKKNEKS